MTDKAPRPNLRTRFFKSQREPNTEPTIWPRDLISHTLEIFVLLGGGIAVGWVILFTKVPFLVYITLIGMELIIFLGVVVKFLSVLATTVEETNRVTLIILETWNSIRNYRVRRKISITITEGSSEKKIDIEVTTDMREIVEIQQLFSLLGDAAKTEQTKLQNNEVTSLEVGGASIDS